VTQIKVSILGEFFFSRLQGKPILDSQGQVVGKIRDIAVTWSGPTPVATGIKYQKDIQTHIEIDQIDRLDESGMTLKGSLAEATTGVLRDDEIYVSKWLLDKQIIDLKGAKIVRVNDIRLAWLEHGHTRSIVLTALDIGTRGLLRRLGVEFLGRRLENNFMSWQFIQPLENKTANLKLSREYNNLSQLHPADIADFVEELDPRERTDLLNTLDDEQAADVLTEVDLDTQVEIIENMDTQRASDILEEMPADEAAGILEELSDEKSQELLDLMEPENAEDVRELMGYDEGTAGFLMTNEYLALRASMTADEGIAELRRSASEAESVFYLYVLDEQEVLQGVISLRELILADPQSVLKDFMHTRLITLHPADDEKDALEIVTKYNLVAVPVVDNDGALLGIITVDDILQSLVPDRSRLQTFSRFASARELEKRLRA